MKKIYLIFVIVIGLIISVNSQTITFQKTFGAPGASAGNYVQQTLDGGYIIAGYATNFIAGAGQDAYLIKTDANGNIQWNKTYGGTNDEQAICVQQTNDGGYIIAGNNSSNGFLIKTNSSGDTIWTKSYGTIFGTSGSFNSVKQTTDGGYIIVGECQFLYQNDNPAFLLKVDNLGNVIWDKKSYWYNGVPYDYEWHTVFQTSDGNYYFVGGILAQGSGSSALVLKTNSAGDNIWINSYGSGYIRDIQKTSDGDYILGGSNITKIDASGNIIWSKICSNVSGYIVTSIQQTSDGNYIAVLSSISTGGTAYILKLDGKGNLLWSKQYQVSGDNIGFNCIKQLNDGSFIIAGSDETNPGYAGASSTIYLIKTDSIGESNCKNDVQYLMSVTNNSGSSIGSNLNSSATPTLSFYPCYVNSPSPTITTLCSTVGIDELSNNLTNLNIYPNPASSYITIENKSNQTDKYFLTLRNVEGQELINKKVEFTDTYKLDVSNLSNGIYFLSLQNDKENYVRKVVIQK